MNEAWARVAVVVIALAFAACVAWFRHRRSAGGVRSVDSRGLAPGVYFFSAESCATCARAREKLDAALGQGGYRELVWERDPIPFQELGIEAVPSVVIVDGPGRGRVFPGQPERALARR